MTTKGKCTNCGEAARLAGSMFCEFCGPRVELLGDLRREMEARPRKPVPTFASKEEKLAWLRSGGQQ